MASTYSNLKIQLMTTGENLSTWGTVTNTNLGTAIEQALVQTADVDLSSGDVTLNLSNTNAAQDARAYRLNCTGATAARNVIVPAIEKPYVVNNDTSYAVTVKVSGQTGVTVPAGKSMIVYNNGTDVVNALTHTPVSSGGTGTNTLTANNVILGNGTSAVQFVAPGTSGNVLTSNGSTWISSVGGFVTGMIMLWSGSIGTIPSGWALCDGSNGTPNLQDRFVVGAGSSYSVGGTGGSTTTSAGGDHNHTGSTGSTTLTAAQIEHYHGIGTWAGDDDWYLPDSGRSWTDDTTMQTSLITGNSGYGPSSNITSGNASTSDVNLNNPSGHTHTISSSGTHTHTITPPYYALAYIMKL